MAEMTNITQYAFVRGQQILCSTGEHSAYTVHGCYEVVQPFDTQTFQDFLASLSWYARSAYDNEAFLEFLLTQGYVKYVPIQELFLGDYGQHVFLVRDHP